MTKNEENMSIKHAVCVLETIGNGLTLKNENDKETACVLAIKAIDELQQYRAIGTVDEFNALKEKNVAKKVKGKHMSDSLEERQLCGEYTLYGYCPNCGESITNLWNSVNCGDCGKKLDWH